MAWINVAKPTIASWIGVAKPTEGTLVSQTAGSPIGLLLALTYTSTVTSVLTGWGKIIKPTTINWTSVPKPLT